MTLDYQESKLANAYANNLALGSLWSVLGSAHSPAWKSDASGEDIGRHYGCSGQEGEAELDRKLGDPRAS